MRNRWWAHDQLCRMKGHRWERWETKPGSNGIRYLCRRCRRWV